MMGLRPTAVSVASILTVIFAAGIPANAQKIAPDRAGDGVATPESCRALGFDMRTAELDRYAAPGGFYGAPSTVAPYPPPPPSPYPNQSQNLAVAPLLPQGTISGGRVAGDVITERYPDAVTNPIRQVAENPVSTFSIDVDTASYSNVRRFLSEGTLPPRDAVRVEEMVNYFDYDYPAPDSAAEPFLASVTVAPSPWAPGRQIVHIGLQGYEIPEGSEPPLNLVFLVDVSGSMQGPDRLELAQKSLNLLIDQLRPEDHVSLAVYAGAAGAVLPPTPGTHKLVMRCAVNALQAGGSTAGGEGLALAYDLAEQNFDDDAVNRVILMTDGDFNVGIANPEMLEDFVAEKRATGVYLSVYGYGRGNYNDLLMQTIAQAGNGTAAYVDVLQEARKLFRDDFASSVFPIADDVKIEVEFNPARVAEYRLIGYETRLLNREDFNNDAVDAGEVGAGASVTALYEITPVGGATAVDPLRYSQPGGATKLGGPDTSGEIAYLRIRYKAPGADTSVRMERPISDADRVADFADGGEATRWALAVAAVGQRLRGDPYMEASFDWDDMIDLAQGARGEDPFGLRAEFVQLIRAAEGAPSLNN